MECRPSALFRRMKQILIRSPFLATADREKTSYVVCDSSDFAIGCTSIQYDADGAERVVRYQSRQLHPAVRNYTVPYKGHLAKKYALAKFRVYMLGDRPFIVCTDHASLRMAISSPYLSQRMSRWLSFFVDYNLSVKFKPERLNVVADALSRRPNFKPAAPLDTDPATFAVLTSSVPSSDIIEGYTKGV